VGKETNMIDDPKTDDGTPADEAKGKRGLKAALRDAWPAG